MWVKLCAPSRGDHILRLVAPWRLHAMACPYISTPAAAPESCSIVAPWRLHPMACPHVARFVGTLLDQCVYIMQKTYISYDTGSASFPKLEVAEPWPSCGRRRAVAVAVAEPWPWPWPWPWPLPWLRSWPSRGRASE